MKTVAYLRVSTAQQDTASQRLAILEYARRQGSHIDEFIIDEPDNSSRVTLRSRVTMMLEHMAVRLAKDRRIENRSFGSVSLRYRTLSQVR